MAARHGRPRDSILGPNTQGKDRLLKTYADWTERIAKGEVLGAAAAERRGAQPNDAMDVGDDHSFMHDEISTDKNCPTVNAGGNITPSPPGTDSRRPRSEREQDVRADIPREPKEKSCRDSAPTRPSLHWGIGTWANLP